MLREISVRSLDRIYDLEQVGWSRVCSDDDLLIEESDR